MQHAQLTQIRDRRWTGLLGDLYYLEGSRVRRRTPADAAADAVGAFGYSLWPRSVGMHFKP